ncbi:UDP-glucose/GDP-mannose dehydrogenase family protein, partial [Candidatus Micrarchaeota archaeon]|nr:UDP-glucose/GDP-mannose dehydrogenase family protein [Candidatus Micrarchaeota archaeon]
PIYEPGLEEVLADAIGRGKFEATTEFERAMDSDVVFIAVGTPSREDGSADLSYVDGCVSQVIECLKKDGEKFRVVVMKSTVPPGTTRGVVERIERETGLGLGKDFGVAMNPEFLREGTAVSDFMKPDRVVVGAQDERSRATMRSLYERFGAPIVETDFTTAEMVKYASNSFLATKISFINEIGNACKELGISVYDVVEGMRHDKRIGGEFLRAGAGYGGSCFPKDVQGLIAKMRQLGLKPRLLESVEEVNANQPLRLVELAKKHLPLKGKSAAVLGLAFKPDTDDVREARSLVLIEALLREGARVRAYDPQAEANAKKLLGDRVAYAPSARECLRDADVCFIVTEWTEFRDAALFSNFEGLVVDGRNVIKTKRYEGICW